MTANNLKIAMLSACFVVFSIRCILFAQLRWGEPATITFHIVDSYGKPVEYRVESFHEAGRTDIDLAHNFQGLTLKGAIQGKVYVVRMVPTANPEKFKAFEQYIAAGQASMFIVFAVREFYYEGDSVAPQPETRFVIRPAPSGDLPVWVTVASAFGPEVNGGRVEAVPVSRDGSFALHGTHGGTYTVTLCQGSKITKVTVLDIPLLAPEKPIEIMLR